MQAVNGIPIATTLIYKEGGFWRWRIKDVTGKEYVDGGNYLQEEAAYKGLQEAYDPTR